MKLVYYFCVTAMAILSSCGEQIVFSEPQPANVSAIDNFPKRVCGTYTNKEQTTTFTVSQTAIIRKLDYTFVKLKSENDTAYTLDGKFLVDNQTGEKVPVEIKGDSIIAQISYCDTLFEVKSPNVLKKFKGHFFLNGMAGTDSWYVRKASFDKGKLSFADLSATEDLQKLREITQSEADTSNFKFTLTKRQFKRLIKEDAFSEEVVYYKINSHGK